ncbi:murein L,D-transpeptidase catalytic domain-containing protein [Croceicoccus mobilis]|uniref:murein L,D-transpeptidase catalytic domain-containing protein n=1 Tax=Croceicoccus mobilis TaxID=1703339 RepID=UPI000835319B|nr:murein L,D-transpeptidase catalytic domain family protein [Croceicoccus mobilis]
MNGPETISKSISALRIGRRGLIRTAAVGAAAAALPAKAFAAATSLTDQQRRILDLARDKIAQHGETLWRRDIAGIADFGVHSSVPRFHFANIEAGTVKSFLVAHGTGSDPEHDGWLNDFSNVPGSNATSRGAYVTYEWYKGKYGTSIRLGGLDDDNSNALPRYIVAHPAEYATKAHVEKWGRLGRSNGCFAMDPADFNEALWHLSGGRLLYADKLGIG